MHPSPHRRPRLEASAEGCSGSSREHPFPRRSNMTFLPKSLKSVNHSEAGCGFAIGGASQPDNLYSLSEPARHAHLDRFEQIDVSVHPDEAIYWGFMRPRARPCFTHELLV